MFELWTVVYDMNDIMPLFLEDRGDFDELYVKFKEKTNTIITNKKGEIIETHIKYN
jgi:hypothetical protein